jgi:hypothetical protein
VRTELTDPGFGCLGTLGFSRVSAAWATAVKLPPKFGAESLPLVVPTMTKRRACRGEGRKGEGEKGRRGERGEGKKGGGEEGKRGEKGRRGELTNVPVAVDVADIHLHDGKVYG